MRFRDKFSDQEWKKWNTKRLERSRAWISGKPILDKFGNKMTLLGGLDCGTKQIEISNEDVTIKLSFGEDDIEGFIRISRVIKNEDDSKIYIGADGKTTIYVGETIEISDNLS